jgi:hypothetical protein
VLDRIEDGKGGLGLRNRRRLTVDPRRRLIAKYGINFSRFYLEARADDDALRLQLVAAALPATTRSCGGPSTWH